MESPVYFGHSLQKTARYALTCLALLALGLSGSVNAGIFSLPRGGTAPAYHSLAGQPGVIRMELHNMYQFLVVKTGDPRAKSGELHKIKINLVNLTPGSNEYFSRDWNSLLMTNRTRHVNGGSGYVPAHRHDVIIVQHRVPDVLVYINVRPGDRVRLEVTARELDCTRQRVCNRGDNSHYSIDMTVPRFGGGVPANCTGDAHWQLFQTSDGRYRFRPSAAENPVRESGDLRIYPVTGQICFRR